MSIQIVFIEAFDFFASVQTELLLFFLAIVTHKAFFGNLWLGKVPEKGKKDGRLGKGGTVYRKFDEEIPRAAPGAKGGDSSSMLLMAEQAYAKSDYKGMVRTWNSLRQRADLPVELLAKLVEAMQRCKRESAQILEELSVFLKKSRSKTQLGYMNKLIKSTCKSLDVELVRGLFDLIEELGLQRDAQTYEALIQMFFTTRSFHEVLQLSATMQSAGVIPTKRTSLVLLKSAIAEGSLDEAIQRYTEVMATSDAAPSVSFGPQGLADQIMELARRSGRVPDVVMMFSSSSPVGIKESLKAPLLNSILAECLRSGDTTLMRAAEGLTRHPDIEMDSRSYQLLLQVADARGNRKRVVELLEEMGRLQIGVTSDIATTVLAMSCPMAMEQLSRTVRLAPKPDHAVQSILIRSFASGDEEHRAGAVLAATSLASSPTNKGAAKSSSGTAQSEPARQEPLSRAPTTPASAQANRRGIEALLTLAPTDTTKHAALIRERSSRGDLPGVLSLFEAMVQSGAELTNALWNSVLDACVECRDFNKAQEFMGRMKKEGVLDAVSYNTMIKACLHNEYFDRARSLMDAMRKQGFPPTDVTYNELLHALVRSDSTQRRSQVWAVVDEMQREGIQPNRITCSILLRNLKGKGVPAAHIARTVELTDNLNEPVDEVLLSSIIEACIRLGKPALVAKKLAELHSGASTVKVCNGHTFGSLIKAYGFCKDTAGAWECWRQMRTQRITPSSITIGCMVEAISSNGDAAGGHELIRSLLSEDDCQGQINNVIYGSVLKGYRSENNMSGMWAAYQEMLANGIEPSVANFNAMIDACARNGQADRAPEVHQTMVRRGLQPNLITYSSLIKAACQRGDCDSALATMQELRKDPSVSCDEIVYNTLIEGCGQAGYTAEAERLLEQMEGEGIYPSNFTLTCMVRVMSQAKRLDRAFELVDTLPMKYRFRANTYSFNALLQACVACREPQRGVRVCEQMVRARIQPDTRCFQNLVMSLASAGHCVHTANVLRIAMRATADGAAWLSEHSRAGLLESTWLNRVLRVLERHGGEGVALAESLRAALRAARLL